MALLTVFVGFYALTGCGFTASPAPGHSDGSRTAQAWAPSGTPLDAGTVFDVTPQIAVEPDGGGTAIAVWIKREDLDSADSFPAVYHLYARRSVSGVPDVIDGVCPAGSSPFGNPDATGDDGTCVIDTGSAVYDAWSPKVSMDNNGDAIVVWQQHDGTAQRVYARRFSGGGWEAIQQLNDSIEFANFDAADPAIALEPDPTDNGAPPDDAFGSAMAVWSQYTMKDWVRVFNSDAPAGPGVDCVGATFNNCASVQAMAVYNGELFAGIGGLQDGSADVFVYDNGANAWSISFNDVNVGTNDDQPDFVTSMAVYNGKLYVGAGDISPNHFFAQLKIYDGSTWTTLAVDDTGVYSGVDSMAVYNGQLYIGMAGNAVGDGDVRRCTLCDGTDWQTVLDSPSSLSFTGVTAMGVYNNQLYIGLQDIFGFAGGAAVRRCSACDGSDWQTVLNLGTSYVSVRSMAVHNGQLYVGFGDGTGDGDIMRCTACGGADWSTVFATGSYEAVGSMVSYNGFLYIGLGVPIDAFASSITGRGDIMRCIVCDSTDWVYSRNDGVAPFTPAAYEAVPSLAVYNGELYAGFGTAVITGGDIWKFSAGWQTVARRFVNDGVGWDKADTVCPAGSGIDGICYISGVTGSSVQLSQSPRVAMDDYGRAIAAFVKHVVLNNCLGGIAQTAISCTDSQLHANLFNGSWNTDINLDPDIGTGVGSVVSGRQLICFENSDAGPTFRGNSRNSDACVNVIEYDLAMNQSGQAALLIKTAWKEDDDWGITPLILGGCDNRESGGCLPDGNAFEDYEGEAIVARQFNIAELGGSCPSWSQANVAACWPLTRLANFGTYPVVTTTDNITSVTTPTPFGIGPFAAGCPSSVTIDGGRVTLNCHFSDPRIALSPGGTTAIAVYENYDGANYNILAHRYDGATWGAFSQIDAVAGDAHAPQIAMDSSGDGVAVWTQSDGAKFRVYSNCYATGASTCGGVAGWQGAVLIDGNVGSESGYFNPVVAMASPGGANSALSLFLGWSVLDNTTRLYYATGP